MFQFVFSIKIISFYHVNENLSSNPLCSFKILPSGIWEKRRKIYPLSFQGNDYNSQYWQYYQQQWSQYAAWNQYSQQYPEYQQGYQQPPPPAPPQPPPPEKEKKRQVIVLVQTFTTRCQSLKFQQNLFNSHSNNFHW